VAKPNFIELGEELIIPILYEDRSVLAIDKPAGWLLAPDDWERTSRNLQLAILSSIQGGEYWAKSRNLKFLRFVHRLDADTSGVLLFCKSSGAITQYSQLFETRSVGKKYLAVVEGSPRQITWSVEAKLAPELGKPAKMKVDSRTGKEAHTEFKVLQQKEGRALLEVNPLTGRSHQIRVHAAHSGLPIVGDKLYGAKTPAPKAFPLGLRAIELKYQDPFNKKRVRITAPGDDFLRAFGFAPLKPTLPPAREEPAKPKPMV
jgi:23S rRNA pseudouridine1911/1915/1917 synthase